MRRGGARPRDATDRHQQAIRGLNPAICGIFAAPHLLPMLRHPPRAERAPVQMAGLPRTGAVYTITRQTDR
jgi:hypothetical protein